MSCKVGIRPGLSPFPTFASRPATGQWIQATRVSTSGLIKVSKIADGLHASHDGGEPYECQYGYVRRHPASCGKTFATTLDRGHAIYLDAVAFRKRGLTLLLMHKGPTSSIWKCFLPAHFAYQPSVHMSSDSRPYLRGCSSHFKSTAHSRSRGLVTGLLVLDLVLSMRYDI